MQQLIINNTDLPAELIVKPLVLIGISGLDTLNNAIHKLIWETFSSNRRAERAPVHFNLIGNAHEFPVIKPKRTSYDWYIPKGILKRNWMNKHLYEIPAVTAIFYDLDWNDPLWNEKMIECASRVQSIRAALEGRNTCIVIVLIQNSLPLPAGEDILASDRAVNLCASCELNASSLFVLPLGDHLQGYAVRLETAFFKFAQNYYHEQIKNVRSHKEHLNKNAHQFLFVRHQFKMGFFYELKQDGHTAHKHYSHAYNNLLEIRIVDTNALEIRTIAGFINYKLCRLMFFLNLPRDAISQFKAHIDRFKHRIGFQELAFEHYAWLSKQFSVFGDIFDEAVKLGLPAVQTQHPGIYYQQAAQYAIIRKRICYEICSEITAYPEPDPLPNGCLDYYGHRPWRMNGKMSAEPPDPQVEMSGIRAFQYLEKQVPHSNIIIALFGLAISQYKTYRCPRTRRHLVLQMADEYIESKDYGKALTLLLHMLYDFRIESWWSLLSHTLEKAIRCAYLTANAQDYCLLALEFLRKDCTASENEKKLIYENLHRILNKQIPFAEEIISQEDVQNSTVLWISVLGAESFNLTLDLSNYLSCIDVKVRFKQKRYEIDQIICLEIFIRSTCPFPFIFTKASVTINTSTTALDLPIKFNNLEFRCNEVKRFLIEFLPNVNDLNKVIQVGSVNLQLGGQSNKCCLNLKFSTLNDYFNQSVKELLHFKYTKDKLDFDNILSVSMTEIVPRNSKLQVKLNHSPPVLLGEWYEMILIIVNKEQYKICDLSVEINVAYDELNICTEFSCNTSGIPEKLPLALCRMENLDVADKVILKFYLRAHKITNINIICNIYYTIEKKQPLVSTKNENILLNVIKPFEITTNFLSSLMMDITKFYVGEEICIMPMLKCLSPIPIIIENTNFEFITPMKSTEQQCTTTKLKGVQLENNTMATELFLAICEKYSDKNVEMGQYIVKWRRNGGATMTTSQLAITGYACEWVPLQLKVILPAYGFVRTPLIISYQLHNRSHQLLQLDVCLEASDAFMFAGYKQYSISILPDATKIIQYNLYPLIAGSASLPKLVLTVPENSTEGPALRQDQLKFLVERSLPTHLFVMPHAKGNNPLLPEILTIREKDIY